jgi:hypothetical protein
MLLSIRPFLIICGALLFFTACQKDEFDTITVKEDPTFDPNEYYSNSLIGAVSSGNDEYANVGCLTVDFPFSLKLEGELTTTVNNYNEFILAIDTTNDNRALDFEYPLQGMDHNGNATVFSDAVSLGTSYASCVPNDGWTQSRVNGTTMPAFLLDDYCLDLVFPVNLEDGQGNKYIAEDILDFIEYTINIEDLFYSLPLSVKDDLNTVDISSLDDMFDVFAGCEEGNYTPVFLTPDSTHISPFDCFTFVYPIDVLIIVPDTVATINSEDELVQLCLSGVEYELLFPVDVIDQAGNRRTLNDVMDLFNVYVDCGIIVIDTTSGPCAHVEAHVLLFFNGLDIFTRNPYEYDFNYPITLVVEGIQVVLNSDDDYIPAIGGDPSRYKSAEIVYPVSVVQFGRTLVFNNDDDVCAFYETLSEPCSNKPAHIQFLHNTVGVPIDCAFFVNYPFDVDINGTVITLNNRDEYKAELNKTGAYDDIELVYPVTASKITNGQQITFNSDSEICDYINICR